MKRKKTFPPPADEDLELWKQFTKGIAPLEKDTPHPLATKKATKKIKSAKSVARQEKRKTPQKGLQIDARLDLHGLSLEQAHSRLNDFLNMAYNQKKSCVLVITGKGTHPIQETTWWEERGILRHLVPGWLESKPNKDIVKAYSPAQQRHGGQGALYVFLKAFKTTK